MDRENGTQQRGWRLGWQSGLAAVLTLGSLGLVLKDVDLGKVLRLVYALNGWWLGLAVISVGATLLAKAARWQWLFAWPRPPALRHAFSAQSVGMFLNAFAPARIGDLARAYWLGEIEHQSKAYILGTIVVEKLVDLFCLGLAVLLLLSQMALPAELRGREMTIGLILGTAGLVWLGWQSGLLMRGLNGIRRRWPFPFGERVWQQIELGASSLQAVQQPRRLTALAVWSGLIWALSVATNYLVGEAMGVPVNGGVALLLLVVLQFGLAVPSWPGRVGIFQYLAILCLTPLAVEKETALGYGVLLHVVTYMPLAVLGGYFWGHDRVVWKKLGGEVKRLEHLWRRA